MDLLTDAQVDWVRGRLFSEPLPDPELESDLLDHFCCFIEEQLAAGHSLENGFKMAQEAIAPYGMQDIQDELTFIMNLDHQTNMKRILYISGFIFSASFSMTILLRHLRWEASVFYLMAFFSLVLFVLPSIGIMAYRNRKMLSTLDKSRMVIGIVAGLAVGIGMIFKSFHFPTANILIATGTLAFTIGFLPIFFYQLYQRANI